MKADPSSSNTAVLNARASHAYKDVAMKELRDRLVVENIGYVRHVLNRTVVNLPERVDRENLEAAGILGLVEASRSFDPSKEVEFTTFATPRIRGAILDELRRNSPLSQKALQRITKVRRASEVLPPPVSLEDIANHTEMTLDEVEETLATMRFANFVSWRDAIHLSEVATLRSDDRPSERLEELEQKELLSNAIQELPERERVALSLYYLEELRMREIGEVMELTESGVSRLLAKAEFRLSQLMSNC